MNKKSGIYANNCGIYLIINPNARCYIGKSCDISGRKHDYETYNVEGQPKIYNSLKKYGWEAHYFCIWELCSVEDLSIKERYWQDYYDCLGVYGLNCVLTATNEKSGCHSEETKRKISESLKGKPSWNKGIELSDTHKKKLSDKLIGRKLSAATKLKMKISNHPPSRKGNVTSAETKLKLSIAMKKKRAEKTLLLSASL